MLVRVGERSWRRRFVRDEPQMTGSYPLALRQLVLRTTAVGSAAERVTPPMPRGGL
jgi:hypothetical protein